jgi:uncharacterized membrane protein
MGKIKTFLYGAAIGAGLMYFMDPQNGTRRKAMLRDQVDKLRNQGDEALDTAVNDLRNRARGVLAEGMALVSNESMPDYVLEERIRARMGLLGRKGRAVQVAVRGGQAELTGDVLAGDVDALLKSVGAVRGVKGVDNRLTTHERAEGIPQLQGGESNDGEGQWSPAARLLATGGAGYLLLYSIFRGGLIGTAARLGGLYVATRALTNRGVRELVGQGAGSGMIRVQKSIHIDAPVEEVYGLWSNFENFAQFMSNIEAIHNTGENRSHWVVKGPAGSRVEFDATTTQMEPNERIAWETTPDSMVQHSGQVRFREMNGGTHVHINMAYTPPAGVAGHAVAAFFGKDPKAEMDADLARMKTLLEKGKTRAEGKKVTRESVVPVTGDSASVQQSQGRGRKKSSGGSEISGEMNDTSLDYQGGLGMSDTDVMKNIHRDMGGGEENTPPPSPLTDRGE